MTTPADLLDVLRRVIRATRVADLADLDFSEDVDALVRLAERLEARRVDDVRMQSALRYNELLDRLRGDAEPGDPVRDIGIARFFPYSPVVGPLNPLAPPIEFTVVDTASYLEVTALFSFDPVHNGPPDAVHGGIVSAVLDELLGSVCVVNDVAGFTGTLAVRYRAPTPLGRPVAMRAWIERVEGRKTFARGTFHDGETLCVEAEGIFISAPGGPVKA